MPPGQCVDWGKGRQRRSAHGHVNAPLRAWFHCLRSLMQYRAAQEATQPSNLARVRRPNFRRCRRLKARHCR